MARTRLYLAIGSLCLVLFVLAYPLLAPSSLQRYVLLEITPVGTGIDDIHDFVVRHNYTIADEPRDLRKGLGRKTFIRVIAGDYGALVISFAFVVYAWKFDESGALTDISVTKFLAPEGP